MKISKSRLKEIIAEELAIFSEQDLDLKDIHAVLSGEGNKELAQDMEAIAKKIEDLEKTLNDMKKMYANAISRNAAVLGHQ